MLRDARPRRHAERGSATLAFLLVVAGAGVPGDRATAQQPAVAFGPAVHVSAALEDLPHVEPHLARDPTDPDRMLAVSMVYAQSGTVARPGIYLSADGGSSWRPTELAEEVTAIDPWATFDREGRAYFLHLPGRVHISADGGETWAPPVDLPRDGIGPLDFPKVLADRRAGPEGGAVYVVSASGERDPAGLPVGPVYVFRAAPGGAFERAARILPARIDYQITTGPVVLPDGRLAVGFSELSHAGELLPPGRIWITRSEGNGGADFPPPSLVTADGGGNVSMAVDRSGGPFHGRLYLAYLRLEDWNLYLMHSDDAGLTWSDPVRVNDAPYQRLTAPTAPALAVDRRGVLGILWPDYRDDEPRGCYAVRFAHSTDGGESVSANLAVPGTHNCPDRPGPNQMRVDRPDGRPVVERFMAGGDYYGLVAKADGGFHGLWSDARTGVFQLWSATIEVGGK